MKDDKWTSAKVVQVCLDVVLLLGLLALGVLALGLLLMPFLVLQGGTAPVSVAVAIGPHSFPPRMHLELAQTLPGAVADGDTEVDSAHLVMGYGELRLETRSWGLPLATALFSGIAFLVVLYAIWALRNILQNVLAGRPFAPANSRRLRRIGFIILAMTVVVPTAEYLIGQAVLAGVNVVNLTLSPSLRFSIEALFAGFLFLVLSAIFRHGTELERERALTV